MVFHENLVYLRKKANLSQEQLAESLNVTRQAVSKWESGQSAPDMEKLLLLSDIFGISTDQLLKGRYPARKEEKKDSSLYTILTFIALAILWLTGLILMIVNLFFNQGGTFQVYVWYESLAMMLFSLLAFMGMLISHKLRERRNEKE